MQGSDGRRERPMMGTVNDELDRLHASLGLDDSDFFCECGNIACKERVRITRADYALLVEEARPVIVPAHALGAPAASVELAELRDQVLRLQGALESRASIEQAKGILAERNGIPLDDAFDVLRKRARDDRRSLVEVCNEVIVDIGSATAEPQERSERHGR